MFRYLLYVAALFVLASLLPMRFPFGGKRFSLSNN